MIVQNAVLIAAIAIPALVLVLLRTNAAIAFLSLCAGTLLVHYVGNEASLAGIVMANNSQVVNQYAELVLLFLPVVVSTLLLRKSVSAAKTALNVIPAIAVGLVGTLVAVPLLPSAVQTAIIDTEGWKLLVRSQAIVMAASVLASLIVLWLTQPSGKGHGHVGKKHYKG